MLMAQKVLIAVLSVTQDIFKKQKDTVSQRAGKQSISNNKLQK